jgi:hypothetical protein
MYVLYTRRDRKESVEYLKQRLERELSIKVDIIFEEKLHTLQDLLNYSTLMKDIDKAGGSFKSYQDFQVKDMKNYEKKHSSLSMNIFAEHVDTFASIFQSLVDKNFSFEVRIYE